MNDKANQQRADLEIKTEAYLERGGKITVLPSFQAVRLKTNPNGIVAE